jgi:hypothetical protein
VDRIKPSIQITAHVIVFKRLDPVANQLVGAPRQQGGLLISNWWRFRGRRRRLFLMAEDPQEQYPWTSGGDDARRAAIRTQLEKTIDDLVGPDLR